MAARMSKGANREDCAAGPAEREGQGPPTFWKKKKEKKKKKYKFSNKRNL